MSCTHFTAQLSFRKKTRKQTENNEREENYYMQVNYGAREEIRESSRGSSHDDSVSEHIYESIDENLVEVPEKFCSCVAKENKLVLCSKRTTNYYTSAAVNDKIIAIRIENMKDFAVQKENFNSLRPARQIKQPS